jgi:hypothetical protein
MTLNPKPKPQTLNYKPYTLDPNDAKTHNLSSKP